MFHVNESVQVFVLVSQIGLKLVLVFGYAPNVVYHPGDYVNGRYIENDYECGLEMLSKKTAWQNLSQCY